MAEPRVTFQMGVTLNTGNFESIKIVVGVEADAMDGEKVDDAMNRVAKYVEHKLSEKMESVRRDLDSHGL